MTFCPLAHAHFCLENKRLIIICSNPRHSSLHYRYVQLQCCDFDNITSCFNAPGVVVINVVVGSIDVVVSSTVVVVVGCVVVCFVVAAELVVVSSVVVVITTVCSAIPF